MKHANVSYSRLERGRFPNAKDVLVEYRYIDNGSSATIAFLNGWGTVSSAEWIEQIRHIKKYNLLFHNNIGMGRSGMTDKRYLHSCARNLGDVCHQFGITEVNLVGHSMGGFIATLFITTPKYRNGTGIKTMTFVNCPDGDPLETFRYRFLLPADMDAFAKTLASGPLSIAVDLLERSKAAEAFSFKMARLLGVKLSKSEFRSMYHSFLGRREENKAAFDAMRRYGVEIGSKMAEIGIPALIMTARDDFFVSMDAAQRIHSRIPDSQIHVFEFSTHAPMLEEFPEFNRVLLRFLDGYNAIGR